jgi:hypothetical protein
MREPNSELIAIFSNRCSVRTLNHQDQMNAKLTPGHYSTGDDPVDFFPVLLVGGEEKAQLLNRHQEQRKIRGREKLWFLLAISTP